MADLVEWDDIEPSKKGKSSGSAGSGKFMKLGPNTERTVRPLKKPVKFFKIGDTVDKQYRSAVIEEGDIDTIKAKYPSARPQQRRACLVFDRDEGNVLRILEGPVSMFDNFKHFKNISKNEPGGPQGGDFLIKTNCPSGKKDRDTTYEVEFVTPVPFTEEEKAQYGEKKEDYDLQEVYKALTIEEVEEKLYGQGQSQTQSTPQTQTQDSPPLGFDSNAGSDAGGTSNSLDW